MKIAINCRVLNKRHGGPKRFLMNILENLSQIDQKNEYILLLDKDFKFEFPLKKNFKVAVLRTESKFIFEYILLPWYFLKNRVDVYFMSDPFFSPLIRAGKKIIVFHDIIYFEKDQKREFNFLDNLHHKTMIRLSGKLSDKNICVSDFTQKRVQELLGIKNTKVIKEAVEDDFKVIQDQERIDQVTERYDLKAPFIFYIGSLSPRKNPLRMIKAFNAIKNDIPHNLYLFGGYSWKDEEVKELLEKTNSDGRIIRAGFVEEEDLPVIYNLAGLYLYPSLYEGFGLPILEAQACGCPVLTSNVSSCPEVAGKGAHIVDPYSEGEIAKGILKVVKEEDYRKKIVENGFENIKRFDWRKSAQELLEEFEK